MRPSPIPDTYLGDSWFTSLDVVTMREDISLEILKKSRRNPKAYLADTMKDWFSDSYLNLKSIVDGRKVFAMDYKHYRSMIIYIYIYTYISQ